MEAKHEIKNEHSEYYRYLERLRRSGETNMWGAVPYLVREFNITQAAAKEILCTWIEHYNELKVKFGW